MKINQKELTKYIPVIFCILIDSFFSYIYTHAIENFSFAWLIFLVLATIIIFFGNEKSLKVFSILYLLYLTIAFSLYIMNDIQAKQLQFNLIKKSQIENNYKIKSNEDIYNNCNKFPSWAVQQISECNKQNINLRLENQKIIDNKIKEIKKLSSQEFKISINDYMSYSLVFTIQIMIAVLFYFSIPTKQKKLSELKTFNDFADYLNSNFGWSRSRIYDKIKEINVGTKQETEIKIRRVK